MNRAIAAWVTDVGNNSLLDPSVLATEMEHKRTVHCDPSGKDRLSSLPVELLDIVVAYALEPHLDARAYVASPSATTRPEVSQSSAKRYTTLERLALEGIPKALWPAVIAIPLFDVSHLLRGRVCALCRRTSTDFRKHLVGTGSSSLGASGAPGSSVVATMRTLFTSDHSPHRPGVAEDFAAALAELETEPLGIALCSTRGNSCLRQLPPSLAELASELIIEADWDCLSGSLLTPVKRLIGTETHFVSLKRVVIRCRLLNLSIMNSMNNPQQSPANAPPLRHGTAKSTGTHSKGQEHAQTPLAEQL